MKLIIKITVKYLLLVLNRKKEIWNPRRYFLHYMLTFWTSCAKSAFQYWYQNNTFFGIFTNIIKTQLIFFELEDVKVTILEVGIISNLLIKYQVNIVW